MSLPLRKLLHVSALIALDGAFVVRATNYTPLPLAGVVLEVTASNRPDYRAIVELPELAPGVPHEQHVPPPSSGHRGFPRVHVLWASIPGGAGA